MRKFALTGMLIAAAFIATTVAGQDAGRGAKVVADPIIIGDCRLAVINKQDVPSQRSGQIKWLAIAELEKGADGSFRYLSGAKRSEPVPTNREVIRVRIEIPPGHKDPENRQIMTEKNGAGDRRYYERYYLQLIEGDVVEANQHIGQLDDRLARAEYLSKEAKIEASKADVEAAIKTRDEAKIRLDIAPRLVAQGAMSQEDARAAVVTYERYRAEHVSKINMVYVAREEMNQARTVLELHEIRSAFRGMIKAIYKNTGEAVRELDPVVQLHNLERLRIEGLVDAQYASRIKKGMKAVVEAPRRASPRVTLKGHLQEVTCVAVTNDPKNPLIVSGSEDGTLRVWDRFANPPQVRSYLHPRGVAFRSVACSPVGAKGNLCLAGDAAGTVWLYDLNNPSKDPVRKLEEGHRSAVIMVAFSPDGSQCVTAGEDRPRGSLCVWNTATGEKLAQPASAHGGVITSVQFTKPGNVVTAARDNTLRLWSRGGDGKYQVVLTLPKRSGDVPSLGVNPAGDVTLFDQGKELRLLSLPEGEYVGSLSNATGTTPFTTLALFSPDGQLILTSGAGEGRMQLWRVPAKGKRGQELVQLIPPELAQLTAGAFAPNGQFLVTGSKDRLVHVWNMPTADELKEELTAEVMHVEPAIESGGRQVRIRADVVNKNDRLLLGDTVTLIINPE